MTAQAPPVTLRATWELRNSAAETLIHAEEQFQKQLRAASAADLMTLLDAFSPARSPGPEWTRSFDPLVERLWAWCDPELLAQVEASFRQRGGAWAPVANALSPEHGAELRQRLLRSAEGGRLPRFTLG
jgi:hypothetical protein